MNIPILDTTKEWVFHFGGLIPNEIPIQMEEKDGVISFDIPLEPERKIRVELLSLNEKEHTIEGYYTVTPLDKQMVIFNVLEAGKLLGRPKGTLVRDVWMLTSK